MMSLGKHYKKVRIFVKIIFKNYGINVSSTKFRKKKKLNQ